MGKESKVEYKDFEQIKKRIGDLEKRIEERKNVKLFRKPIKTIKYFVYILWEQFVKAIKYFQCRPYLLFFISLVASFTLLSVYMPGEHQKYMGKYSDLISIGIWWVGLGVLSSIGLGTGLHTFVLYLGPHIAKVTLAATEWNSVDFNVYGPNAFIQPTSVSDEAITFWMILQKVQWAALLWGAGTAIGELPPYFVARTARLKGLKLEKEKKSKEENNLEKKEEENKGLLQKLSDKIPALIGNLGFFGILAFASIPNPLFDLAGITCGHFLVPFWKFFGATFIGKAVIKAHIQACFVILAFNMSTLTMVISFIEAKIPFLKNKIQPILEKERQKLNSNIASNAPKSFVGILWDGFLFLMISYFIISIVESSVQEYLIEKDNKKIKQLQSNKHFANNENIKPKETKKTK
ncbi:hypothetical protein DICPUDRAFT_82663 [Dictyostelium purpureum]|uniref:Vacuole membrane protein n=1 Tax=Dictyostelium purpureum TaxID=5786 RepID=F0ZX72_DICPU|nr:uncharacterized protein DICPUDRAFT_82663 [Dictyostelium purpureum]EGC31453.1 hypothetical protein DICPUDRAFT_82663 [Dictyostelium purpureum]|eukprot:XP_003292022.1 hypothetical protein DICPUDRAFT_82663 [Dictyostelium purpureum]